MRYIEKHCDFEVLMFKFLLNGIRVAAWAYLAAFIVWSLNLLFMSPAAVTGAMLQLVFVLGLFIWRRRRSEALFCIPDEMLVCLPYFWAMANSGSAHHWSGIWAPWLALVSIISLPAVYFRGAFPGGCKNTLLISSVSATLFVLVFVALMQRLYPLFPLELYHYTLSNLILAVAGIPVSIAAFYGCRFLLPLSASDAS